MKIYRSLTIDIETGRVLEEDSFEYDGPLALCDRSAQSSAGRAASNAGNAAAGYGSTASTIGSQLLPYYTQQLYHPAGMSQQDIGSQLAFGMGGAGGATSGITGQANLQAARSNNTAGFTSALDAAARDRAQAAAKTSEGIAARNANVKLQQQQDAGRGLSSLYGMSAGAQAREGDVQNQAIQDQIKAGQTGWLQNLEGIAGMLSGGTNSAANLMKAMKMS